MDQTNKMLMFRQGDVLIEQISHVPSGLRPVERDRGRVVLAYGEVTGHAHAIVDPECDLFEHLDLEDRFLNVLAEGGVELRHEEHGTIVLPPGQYRVRQQREYSPERIRRVAD